MVLLANDMETFQKIMSKMHSSLVELQEINKDVLLGKKNPNCLSCNKGKDGFENLNHVTGQDGKMYIKSGGAKAKPRTDDNLSDNRLLVLNNNS